MQNLTKSTYFIYAITLANIFYLICIRKLNNGATTSKKRIHLILSFSYFYLNKYECSILQVIVRHSKNMNKQEQIHIANNTFCDKNIDAELCKYNRQNLEQE